MTASEQLQKTKRLTRVFLFTFIVVSSIVASSITSCNGNKSNNISKNQHKQKISKNKMKKILIIGMNPNTIDFTNPELPQGLSVEIIEKGTNATLEKLHSLGYDAETFLINTGANDLSNLANQLNDKNYDGVVIGNGIRGINANFILFEQIINVIHTNAPKSKIIFNTLPTNTDEAVKRWF